MVVGYVEIYQVYIVKTAVCNCILIIEMPIPWVSFTK